MTYLETINFLFYQLPAYQNSGISAYKENLNNIIDLVNVLGDPQNDFKSIHVGGTNGKGSVSKMLTSIFIEAGYKVGIYTSPHYIDFRERIQVNGDYISKDFVVDFVTKIRKDIFHLKPSFFEITVAMAFEYFRYKKVDIAIIEVGLGGRLDSTNIINPELSIITNISFDHQNILGDTLPKIAIEKAGIIKPLTPVIIGKTQVETEHIFKNKASELNSPIYFADQQVEFTKKNGAIVLSLGEDITTIDNERLLNNYQVENLSTSYMAFEVLKKDWNLSLDHFELGIKNIEKNAPLIGRWQVVGNNPKIILDSSHNYAGIKSFVDELKNLEYENLHLVYGTVSDKDVNAIIDLFPLFANYYLTSPSVLRAMPVGQLELFFDQDEFRYKSYDNATLALQGAIDNATEKDVIACFGSIFLIADVLKNI